MANEWEMAYRSFYTKLLKLYPKVFRERFGESMEQTFDDLCNERNNQSCGGLFSVVLWMSADTGIGIVREHKLLIKQGDTMKNITSDLRSAAIISFILVLPFLILEFVNRRNTDESFPVALFGFMWLLPIAFIVILMPMARNARAGNIMMANPINLLLRVVFLTVIAMLWGYSLYDQLPCFLGVPNCD